MNCQKHNSRMFISAIQELSFHRKTGVTLKWRTRFLLCVEQCSKDSILLMCVECIPALYPYGNSWVVGKALWHIKTRHHQDFHLDDAWFMFSNPVRQMPYISNFRGLLFYDHPSNAVAGFFAVYVRFMCAVQTVCPCAQRFFLLPKMPLRGSLTASFIDSA